LRRDDQEAVADASSAAIVEPQEPDVDDGVLATLFEALGVSSSEDEAVAGH
jgi:hypothetical protein